MSVAAIEVILKYPIGASSAFGLRRETAVSAWCATSLPAATVAAVIIAQFQFVVAIAIAIVSGIMQ